MITTNSIPGFTAEASLRHPNKHYRLAMGRTPSRDSVIPQRIREIDWACECDSWTGICVCTSGGHTRVVDVMGVEL